MTEITHIFLDIGGVLLTNGWDHLSRKEASLYFNFDFKEAEERHRQIFPIYEEGKISLEEYLKRAIFFKERAFSKETFESFMYAQSKPYQEMIELMIALKIKYRLKIVVVSNEGRELNIYRIKKFKLSSFVDSHISSSFVHLRKPDVEIFKLALDISQAEAQKVIYIENTIMHLEVAKTLEIQGILHKNYALTKEALKALGVHV